MSEKIGVVVIDDDLTGRKLLKTLIGQHDSLALLGLADSAASGADLIREERPDAIFLDIQMPGESGFDLLRGLTDPPKVVFVTCSPSHSLKAFEVEAVDYLLKPVMPPRFAATVQRLKRLFLPEPGPAQPHEASDRICLRANGQTHIVPLARLVALQAEGNFTRVHCADGSAVLSGRSIGDYAESLPSPPFARLDRSLIVNIDRMTRADRLSRNLSQLWIRGLSQPLELGRTATENLKGVLR